MRSRSRPLRFRTRLLRGAVCSLVLGGVALCGTSWAGDEQVPSVVLLDGQRIETESGFDVEGKMVVFTDLQGQLRSIPLRDVDLEASRRLPEPPTAAPEKPAEDKKLEPVLVLDNDDLPNVAEAERKRAREAEALRQKELDLADRRSRAEQGSGGGRRARPRRPISSADGTTAGLATIGHWSSAASRQTGGTQIVGSVVNPSEKSLDRVTVKLKFYDEDGKLVKTGRAFLDRTRLSPGLSTNFRYVDPSLQSMNGLTVEFQVTARALSWGARPHMPESGKPAPRSSGSGNG